MEVGLVEKAFWCHRDEANAVGWRLHELYFFLLVLAVPGGVMSVAYGSVAREMCRCVEERVAMTASSAAVTPDDALFAKKDACVA